MATQFFPYLFSMKHKHWLILFLFLTIQSIHAQQFGGFPPSTRWKQINTDTARIIFSPGAEEQAQRIATLIGRVAADTPYALGNRLRKVNIVLHSRTTLANGYVALAPFRSEYYLIPGANVYDFGNLPWQENLAIHEYRHVQQYNNFKHGLSKGFFYLFGEGGQAFANALTVPGWFFEGDAVHSETALTPQGRGRLPYFLSGYNSLWLDHKNYSWQKLRNGSLKDYVPNHYQLGYLLVNYGYLNYSDAFWKDVTSDATAFRGLFYPFQKAISRYAGVDYKTFRKDAFSFYQSKLGSEERPQQKSKTVTNYYYPQFIGADTLLYLKSAYNRLPAFYLRTGTGERRIALRNISSEEWFSYRNGTVAYTAYGANPRWDLIDYSDIVLLNIRNGVQKKLTRKQKYYTPDFSPSGEQIVAVRIGDSLQTQLQVLNSSDGSIAQTIPSFRDAYFTNPRFIDDHHIIAGVRTPDARMSLQLFDLQQKKWEELIPFSNYSISVPSVHGDRIYFTANFSGNDDLYAFDLKERKLFQLTSRLTGTYFPSVSEDSLIFSFFTADGLQLESMELKKALWRSVGFDALKGGGQRYPVALAKNILSTPDRRFSFQRYRQSTALLNFHSWRPDYSDPELTFSLYSDNILNTFSNEIFYRYNRNEKSHGVGWNSSYGGFFPQLNAGVEYTYNRSFRDTARTYTFDESEVRLGFNIPLNLTKANTYRYFNIGADYVMTHRIPTGISKNLIRFNNPRYLNYFLTWAQYLPEAPQHIYPKVGYTLSLHYRDRVDRKGYQTLTSGQLFLPSIANHSIVLSGSYQDTDTNSVFSNNFVQSRGYTDLYFARMWRFSANYHFPIVYPDLGLASIVYFQRLRGNLFYDVTQVYRRDKTPWVYLRSVGGELFFDTKWWNELPVSFGIRASYLLDNGFTLNDQKGKTWFEFILPLNLIPD